MVLIDSEKEKIKVALRTRLLERFFRFRDVEILQKDDQLRLVFQEPSHTYFKDVIITSNESYIKDTTMFTYVYIVLRFKYNGRTSPVIGHNLMRFRIVLQ